MEPLRVRGVWGCIRDSQRRGRGPEKETAGKIRRPPEGKAPQAPARADLGRDSARSECRRVSTREYNGANSSTLAAGKILGTLPAVLSLQYRPQGDRLRLGQ